MKPDNKTLYICRAPGCGLPFTNQAGRRNHESKVHVDIYESFKGNKGEILHFKSTALRDKAKKKIRNDLKNVNGATPPVKKKTVKKETPAPEVKPPAESPPNPAPKVKPEPEVETPPETPERQHSHHNPNPKKKKGFWDQANDWWQGETQVK